MTARTPRGQKAVDAWPDRLTTVLADPTDENLQSLCTLLDAIDAWAVEAYGGTPSRDERTDTLLACRADAREANRAVTERMRQTQATVGRRNSRKRAPTP